MLGTAGGAIAVHAASPSTTAPPPAIVQPAQADAETADGSDTGNVQDQQGSQVENGTPDTATGTNAPDTDNVQDGSGSQVQDGTPDVPGAVTP
jgi:transglutaminase/protease-like cytokinesis protein 3